MAYKWVFVDFGTGDPLSERLNAYAQLYETLKTNTGQNIINYIVAAIETCPTTARAHIQGYICLTGQRDVTWLKRHVSASAHWDRANAKDIPNRNYVLKTKNPNHPDVLAGRVHLELDLPSIEIQRDTYKLTDNSTTVNEKEPINFDDAIEHMMSLPTWSAVMRCTNRNLQRAVRARLQYMQSVYQARSPPKPLVPKYISNSQAAVIRWIAQPAATRQIGWIYSEASGTGMSLFLVILSHILAFIYL